MYRASEVYDEFIESSGTRSDRNYCTDRIFLSLFHERKCKSSDAPDYKLLRFELYDHKHCHGLFDAGGRQSIS